VTADKVGPSAVEEATVGAEELPAAPPSKRPRLSMEPTAKASKSALLGAQPAVPVSAQPQLAPPPAPADANGKKSSTKRAGTDAEQPLSNVSKIHSYARALC
jgi:hypothetical protein